MNIIDKFLPILGVAIGWGLSEFSKSILDRKNDKRKFKKLLFNLLELRWLLKREVNLIQDISVYLEKLKSKLEIEFGKESNGELDFFKPIITEILKEKIVDPVKIKLMESNLDITILELSEIYPVFAYELSDRYKIKEKLEKADKYFEEVSSYIENFPIDIKEWIQPKLSEELIDELDKYILAIARKIGWRTKKNIKNKLRPFSNNNDEEMDKLIDEYIERIKPIVNNG